MEAFREGAGQADRSSLRIHRDRRARRGGRRAVWVILLLVLLAAGGSVYYFRESLLGLGPLVETGTVARVGGAAESALLTANGYVVPRRQAGVTPKITGRIMKLNRDLGDRVKEGEVLAELENKDILATLEEARATSWVANLTAERDRKLVESNIGSQAEYDLSLARAKEAAARVKNLEEAVESTNVRAPFDGTIIGKNGEVGETVSLFGGQTSRKSGPIFVIAAFNEFEVEADVNESNIGKVEAGQPAEVELVAVPQKRYAGRLRQVVPTADRQKGTIQAKVEILDPDEKVFPEMTAKVIFLKSAPVAS